MTNFCKKCGRRIDSRDICAYCDKEHYIAYQDKGANSVNTEKKSFYTPLNSSKSTSLNEPAKNKNNPILHKQLLQSYQFISVVPLLISSILLIVAIGDWPYSYFMFLKWVVTATCIYYIIKLYKQRLWPSAWYFVFGGLAILYNPIIRVFLYDKSLWNIVNIITLVLFYAFYKLFHLAFHNQKG